MTVKVRDQVRGADNWTQQYYYNDVPSGKPSVVPSSRKQVGQYKMIDSVYTGKFTPGVLRLNPVTIHTGMGTFRSGIVHTRYKPGYPPWAVAEGWRADGPWISSFPEVVMQGIPSYDPDLESQSAAKAYANLNQAKLDVTLMVGELGETLSMLKNPLRELINLLKNLGNPKRNNPMAIADFLGNSWLMYKYGIMPLIQDMENIRKHFRNQLDNSRFGFKSVRGTKKREQTFETAAGSSICSWCNFSLRTTDTLSVKSTTHVYYQIVLEADARFRAKYYGYDITQLPALAWELIPYSFVADWFINFGDWLLAISPSSHADVLGSCTSQVIKRDYVVEPVGFWPTEGTTLVTASPCAYNWHSETLIRQVGTTKPAMPALNSSSLSLAKMCTSIALILQQAPQHWRLK